MQQRKGEQDMSDDLVKRLRLRVNEPGTPSVREDSDLLSEAADEIERLRADNEKLRAACEIALDTIAAIDAALREAK